MPKQRQLTQACDLETEEDKTKTGIATDCNICGTMLEHKFSKAGTNMKSADWICRICANLTSLDVAQPRGLPLHPRMPEYSLPSALTYMLLADANQRYQRLRL